MNRKMDQREISKGEQKSVNQGSSFRESVHYKIGM